MTTISLVEYDDGTTAHRAECGLCGTAAIYPEGSFHGVPSPCPFCQGTGAVIHGPSATLARQAAAALTQQRHLVHTWTTRTNGRKWRRLSPLPDGDGWSYEAAGRTPTRISTAMARGHLTNAMQTGGRGPEGTPRGITVISRSLT